MSAPIEFEFVPAPYVVDPQNIRFEWGRGLFINGSDDPYSMPVGEVVFGTPPDVPDPPDPEPEPEEPETPDPFGIYAGVSPPRLSDPIPLLSTGPWGTDADLAVLPAVYGRDAVTVKAVRYLTQRTWVVAGHACAAVVAVRIDGAAVDGWTHRNGVDVAGRPVCFIDFTEPQSGDIEADVIGRLGARSGAVLSNPADIATDFLREVCGYPLVAARLATYRQQASGISLAGALTSVQTIRAALDTILGSAGAAWSGAAPAFATSWPPLVTPTAVAELTPATADSVSSQTIGDPVTVLHVEFDESVAGQPRQSLSLRAPMAVRRFGRVERTLSLPWTRSERQAEAIGIRWLSYYARPVWQVTAAMQGRTRAGEGVSIDHPLVPLTGTFPVTTAEAEPTSLRQVLTVEGAAGAAPRVERV